MAQVKITEYNGLRLMHLKNSTIQSAMRLNAPYDLELEYTRCMMIFLLFIGNPKNVVMIGLGGGSLAKYVYYRMPNTNIVAIENNPHVIAAAQQHFLLPAQDDRFAVKLADGADFIAPQESCQDIILVDGYDAHYLPRKLSSRRFYEDCHRALRHQGILIVNLWGSHPHFDTYLKRIEAAFPESVMTLPTRDGNNIIVIGFKNPVELHTRQIQERAHDLARGHKLEFTRWAKNLKRLNPAFWD